MGPATTFWLTVGSALTSLFAAAFTAFAALGAWRSAKAAGEQVELQRPRPVVTLEGTWSLDDPNEGPKGFLVRNVGSSPAFDIQISRIDGPKAKRRDYGEGLITDPVRILAQQENEFAVSHRVIPSGALYERPVANFVQITGAQFLSPEDGFGLSAGPFDLRFSVTYSTLQGRSITTECVLRYFLGIDGRRACVLPATTWLGEFLPTKG